MKPGDRFTLAEEGIDGTISEIHTDDIGNPEVVIVALACGCFAVVEMSKVKPRVLI